MITSSLALSDDAYSVYLDTELQGSLKRIINPRRGPTQSVPGLDIKTSLELGDTLFRLAGLPEYAGCVTAEMKARPIPHVFRREETAGLTDLYTRWAPIIFTRIFRELEAPIQTYNKVSRLGWPEFVNPDNKRTVLEKYFNSIEFDGLSFFKSSFIIVNVRLQAEAKGKSRAFLFVNDDGRVYEKETTEESRTIEVHDVGRRVTSRTRAIFNMPIPNLYKQVLDSAIHNVFLRYPAFHHDMFNNRILPVEGEHLCLDVKHFERFTADAVRARGRLLGGLYSEISSLFADISFAVPSDSYKNVFFIKPNREAGYSDQFSSGDSAVAPVQKEVFTALYSEYFKVTRALSNEEAINLTFNGGDEKLTIRNYGDDNSLSGQATELSAVTRFLSEYLHVEPEVPPKFLGFVWYEGLGWRLPPASYLLKTYLNERRPYSNFRRFPNLGWVEKRHIFEKLGHPYVAKEIFPRENIELARRGLPWSDIVWRGEQERIQAASNPGQLLPNFILGKDYALTAQEKLQTGEFIGLLPEKTSKMIKRLVDTTWFNLTRLR